MNKDFVPFELAAKLKEKGFREKCIAFYTSTKTFYYNNTNVCADVTDLLDCCNAVEEFDDIDAPTISQVLEWLREEKKIFIEIGLCHDGYFAQINTDVHWDKDFADEEELFYTSHPHQRIYGNITPEQAALAGIEYILNNLI